MEELKQIVECALAIEKFCTKHHNRVDPCKCPFAIGTMCLLGNDYPPDSWDLMSALCEREE